MKHRVIEGGKTVLNKSRLAKFQFHDGGHVVVAIGCSEDFRIVQTNSSGESGRDENGRCAWAGPRGKRGKLG